MNVFRSKWVGLILSITLIFASPLWGNSAKASDNSWSPIGLFGASIESLAIDPNNDAVIYAGANGAGLFKSTDYGNTWTNISTGLPALDFSDIAVSPEDSNVVYVAINQGSIYKSINGGISWMNLNTAKSFSVAIHPLDENIILFGGFDGGIFRSTDGGVSWQAVVGAPQSWLGARVIAFAPNAPHIVYAAGFDGVWKSIDSGQTWAEINSSFAVPLELFSLAIDPYDSQVVYIGSARDGLYKTTNGGATWTPIGTGLASSHIAAIAINPGNQQLLYVGGGINPGTGTPGVYKSLDNEGKSWAAMMDGMGSRPIYRLVMDNLNPRNIYAGTSGGIWKYTLANAPSDFSISINNGNLFTNTTDVTLTLSAPSGTSEMMISNDGGFSGISWEPYSTEKSWTLTSYGNYVIPRIVYAKFRTNGVTSGLYQDDIVVDVTAPTGSIEINTITGNISLEKIQEQPSSIYTSIDLYQNLSYLPLVLKNARPGFQLVSLQLSASDDMSGVSKMMIGSDAGFSGMDWESYATSKEWWMPQGLGTVYVKYQDRAGNVSTIYNDTYTP